METKLSLSINIKLLEQKRWQYIQQKSTWFYECFVTFPKIKFLWHYFILSPLDQTADRRGPQNVPGAASLRPLR